MDTPKWKHHITLFDLLADYEDSKASFTDMCDGFSRRLMEHKLAKEDADNIEYFAEGFTELGQKVKDGEDEKKVLEKYDELLNELYEYGDDDGGYLLGIE